MSKLISRCGICNCVSSEEIATNSGDWRPGTLFAPDPKSGDFDVCLSCLDSYQEVMTEFYFMEDEDEITNESAFEYWDDEVSDLPSVESEGCGATVNDKL